MARFAAILLVALCAVAAARAAPAEEQMTQIKAVGVSIVKALLDQGANTNLAAGGNNPTTIGRIAGSKSVQGKSKSCKAPANYAAANFDFSALGIARFDIYGMPNVTGSLNITIAAAALVSGAFVIPTSIPQNYQGSDLATYLEVGAAAISNIGARNKENKNTLGAWAGAYAYTLSTLFPTITPALEPADNPTVATRTLSGLDVQATLGAIGTIGQVPKGFGPSEIKLTYSKSGPAFYLYAQLNGPAVLANITKPGVGFICGRLFAGGFQTSRVSLPSTLSSALISPATTDYSSSIKQPLAVSQLQPTPLRLPARFGFDDIPFGTCDGVLPNPDM